MEAESPIPNVPGIDPAPIPEPRSDVGRVWLTPTKYSGPPRLHPWEIPMLALVIAITLLGYVLIIALVATGTTSQIVLTLLAFPLLLLFVRGTTYANPRVNGVQMTPTQFPEGFRMVVEAASRYGLEYVPDAYVVLGNGQINAFASGHGFRRFVVVYSDLFEIGGKARDPEALQFIIGHEVGHIAAGHTAYWRQLGTVLGMNIPVLGSALSRAQEYTADNYGYYTQPSGAPGVIGVLSVGKYMGKAVDFDQVADRATHEKGFFTWVVNLLSTHPVNTWRAAALRDRSRAGSLFLRPKRFVRGIGSGNVNEVASPAHPVTTAPGSLPNGISAPPKI